MSRIILDCGLADVCLPDYWGGHHLAHVQISINGPISLKQIKQALHNELSQGAVMGNNPLTRDDSGLEGDKWYKAAHAAVNKIKPSTPGKRLFFKDIEPGEEDRDSVYAYFVFE